MKTRNTHIAAILLKSCPGNAARFIFPSPALTRDYAADRDNFQHAWEYALHNKLPNNLADLATGMIKFMDSQGIQPTATIDAAVALVPQIGTPSTDPAALNLKAAQLRARQMVTAAPEVNRQYISLIEESSQGEQYELCYWLCIQLAMQWRMVNDPSLIDWLDVAQTMAEKLADETLVKMVIGIRVWGYLAAGRPVAAAEAQLVALLPYFESRYPDSFILYGVLSSLSMVCDDEGAWQKPLSTENGPSISPFAGEIYFGSAVPTRSSYCCTNASGNSILLGRICRIL